MKTCTRCGVAKDEGEFRKMHGRVGQPCLECHRKANAEWRAANPDKMQAARDGWMATPEHVEQRKAAEHERYVRQSETFNARSMAWRQENRARNLEARRKWYKNNPDKGLGAATRYRHANPDKVKASASKWKHNNPERDIEDKQRRRARLYECAVNDFTAHQWRVMIAQYGHRCAYCGLKHDKLAQDHIVPLSRGGNNTVTNIVPACKHCNSVKHAKTPQEAGMKFRVIVRL